MGGRQFPKPVRKHSADKAQIIQVEIISAPKPIESESGRQPWYQSTLLWGAFSLALTIVFTVVAAMTKDVRWALFGALPFATIAVWEFLSYFIEPKKVRALITGLISLVLAIGLLVLYARLKPESPIDTQQSLPVGGASPEVPSRARAAARPASPPKSTKIGGTHIQIEGGTYNGNYDVIHNT